MLQNQPDEALEVLRRDKPLGVRIVLDRVASRASSIGLLTDFPFDKVKIKRRPVQSASDRPAATVVVSGLIRLCRCMGAIVGADGIDTRRHLDALAPHRDTEIQGDVLGGPRTADEVAALCSGHGPRWSRGAGLNPAIPGSDRAVGRRLAVSAGRACRRGSRSRPRTGKPASPGTP